MLRLANIKALGAAVLAEWRGMIHDYFPPLCLLCERPAVDFCCADCQALCPPLAQHCLTCATPVYLDGATCGACSRNPPPIDAFFAAKRFVKTTRQVVLAFKFHRSPVAQQIMVAWWEDLSQRIDLPRDAVVMPLPLSWLRLMWRGFNQADCLAAAVAQQSALPLQRGILRRRFRVPQSMLAHHRARAANIQSAFFCRGDVPPKIVLVDDVMTSGATLHAAAQVLKQHGATWVGVVCVAAAQPTQSALP